MAQARKGRFQVGALLSLLLFLTSFIGCAALRTREAERLALPDVLEVLRKREEEIKTLAGYVRIGIEMESFSHSLRGMIYLKRPNLLRLETMGFLGFPSVTIIFNRGETLVYPPFPELKEEFSPGKIWGIEFKVADLIDSLLGTIDWKQGLEGGEKKVTLRSEKNFYELEVSSREGKLLQRIGIDRGKLLVRRRELYSVKGTLQGQMVVKDIRFLDKKYWLPSKIILFLPEERSTLFLTYGRIKVNVELSDALFSSPR